MRKDGDDKTTVIMDIYNGLYELAQRLSRAVEAVGSSDPKAEQMGTLAVHISQVRYLLQVLVHGYSQVSAVDLMTRYLDLEGQIKQIRNDLERASGSHDVQR